MEGSDFDSAFAAFKAKKAENEKPEEDTGFIEETRRTVVGGARDAAESTKNLLFELGGMVSKKLYTTDLGKKLTGNEDLSDQDIETLVDQFISGKKNNTELPEVDEPESTAGQVARPIVQFLVPFGIAGKAKGIKAAEQGIKALAGTSRVGKLAGTFAAGAPAGIVADMTAFEGHEQRLSNMLTEIDNPVFNNAVTQYLAADESDSDLEGRLKQAIEGVAAGGLTNELFLAVKAMKGSVKGTTLAKISKPKPVKAIRDFVKKVKETPNASQPKGESILDVGTEGVDLTNTNAKLNEILGREDAGDIKHIVQESGVKHALNKHSTDAIPLKEEDFELIPDILSNPDNIRHGGDSKLGNQTVVYEKHYGDRVVYVEELIESRKKGARLRLQTMYWNELGKEAKEKALRATATEGDRAPHVLDDSGQKTARGATTEGSSSHVQNATGHINNMGSSDLKVKRDVTERILKLRESVADTDDFSKTVKGTTGGKKEALSLEAQKKIADMSGLTEQQLLDGRLDKIFRQDGIIRHLNKATKIEADAFDLLRQSRAEMIVGLQEGGSPQNVDNFLGDVLATLEVHEASKGAFSSVSRALGERGHTQAVVTLNKVRDVLAGANRKSKQDIARDIASLLEDGPKGQHQALTYLQNLGQSKAARAGALTRDVLNEFYMNSILSSPKTLLVDTISNMIWSPYVATEKLAAGTIGKFRAAMTGNNNRVYASEAGIMMQSYMQSVKDTWRLIGKSFKEGEGLADVTGAFENMRIDNETRFDVPRSHRAISAENFAEFGVGKDTLMGRGIDYAGSVINFPSTYMQNKDDVAKALLYRAEVAAQAHRQAMTEGLTGAGYEARVKELMEVPLQHSLKKTLNDNSAAKVQAALRDGNLTPFVQEGIEEEAIDFARINTFQEDLGPVAKSIQNALNTLPGGRILIPFIKTPTNLAKQLVRRTPLVGLAPGFYRDIAAGGARADMAMGRLAMGTGIFMLGYEMALTGNLTGAGGVDIKETNMLKGAGWRPNSVRIGDTYVDIGRYDPISSIFLSAANFVEISDFMGNDFGEDVERDMSDYVSYSILAISESLLSKTFMKSVSEMLEAVANKDVDQFKTTLNFIGSSFAVPNAVNFVANEVNEDVPNPTTLLETIQARTGFLERPKRDMFGRPIKRDPQTIGYILPSSYHSVDNDPVIEEMIRVQAYIPKPTKRIDGVRLDIDQYDELLRILNEDEDVYAQVGRLMETPVYKSLGDPLRTGIDGVQNMTKPGLIKMVYSKALGRARDKLLAQDEALRDRVDQRRSRLKTMVATTPGGQRFLEQNNVNPENIDSFIRGE